MPSTFLDTDSRPTRRQVVASFGAIATSALSGCSGQLPGTTPTQLDAETTVETDGDSRVLWEYPPREDDEDGIGYAAVKIDRITQSDGQRPQMHLTFNSTIGGIASSPPYEGYQSDWFRFRIWPPTAYEGRISHEVRVAPPGQWERFSTYYDIQSSVRQTTVELRNAHTQGTIRIPAVFDPGAAPLPERLHCSFTVQASRPGFFGETVRVAGQDTLPLGKE